MRQLLTIEHDELWSEFETIEDSPSPIEEELELRVEEAICRYDGRILIGGEPRDAAEWAVREVSVWLRTPAAIRTGNVTRRCVEDIVSMARKDPNSVDILLREMVGRFVRRKPGVV